MSARVESINQNVLHELYIENSCVDVHFNTQMFLLFLRELLNRDSINNGKLLVSLFNVPNLDNAFFTGEYMIYGNGDKMFYPLGAVDVSAHELTHGLVQSTAGLQYVGHSGALNESFSDVMVTSFEFWLYDRFNNNADTSDYLQGEFDWLCGEDIGKTVKYLRNLRDPTKAEFPQPKKYGSKHWANPNKESARHDYGGVHINSGISNRCFYLLSESIGIDNALPIFYNCLLRLGNLSDFIDFRNTLVECAGQHKGQTVQCLTQVGLHPMAVSDWLRSPRENRVPQKPKPEPQPSPTPAPQPEPTPNPEPTPTQQYPNPHIPYIRGLCCPHCLCLTQAKRIAREDEEPVLRRSKRRKR